MKEHTLVVSVRERKAQLRKTYKRIRGQMDREEQAKQSEILVGLFAETYCYRFSKRLLLYYPLAGEPDIRTLIHMALRDGKQVFLPKTYEKRKMSFWAVEDQAVLVPGSFGIPEPPEMIPYTVPQSSDVCLVPGLCFDVTGRRIGYGGGYYDRFLAHFPGMKVSLLFDECLTESPIPYEKRYDKPVDYLISPGRQILTPSAFLQQ